MFSTNSQQRENLKHLSELTFTAALDALPQPKLARSDPEYRFHLPQPELPGRITRTRGPSFGGIAFKNHATAKPKANPPA